MSAQPAVRNGAVKEYLRQDEAFRDFGGMSEECVYDQTKMVVIAEQFRELEVN